MRTVIGVGALRPRLWLIPIGGTQYRSPPPRLTAPAVALLASKVDWSLGGSGGYSRVQAFDKFGAVRFAVAEPHVINALKFTVGRRWQQSDQRPLAELPNPDAVRIRP